jgi:hypothetical protein
VIKFFDNGRTSLSNVEVERGREGRRMAGFDRDTNIESIKKIVFNMGIKIDEINVAINDISKKMDIIIEMLKNNKNN